MKRKRPIETIFGLTLAVILIHPVTNAGAQHGSIGSATPLNAPTVPNAQAPYGSHDHDATEMSTRSPFATDQIEKSRKNDRQKHLVADTNRLLALTAELKDTIHKTTGEPLSEADARKIDEIEKLAHSVKERMKN